MKHALNAFERLAALGYPRLVPIIPPDAKISERSSLYKRVGTTQDGRGKTPGIRGHDGNWFGFDWVPYDADEQDYQRWAQMKAGIGIKTGAGLVAIDADTKDHDHARTIKDVIEQHIGRTPIRVGQYPKALYVVRTSGDVPYQRIEFGPPADNGASRKWRVELLSDKRQFVAEGIHPKTNKPYAWPRELVAFDDLPEVTPDQLTAILNELRETLPDTGPLIREGGTTEINQDALRGDPDTVERAVQNTPNTSEHFPSRESYRDFGYAIKAALPDDETRAFDIFAEWCQRWQDGENDPDVVAADWNRMKPPYRRGATWLYELATDLSSGQFSIAEHWFDDLETIERNPFEEATQRERAETDKDTFPVLTVEDIRNRPPAEWLIERHVPKRSVGFIYSVPGAGKSFLTLDMSLHIASGATEWHGDPIVANDTPRVLYIAAEGSYGFKNRINAWLKRYPHAKLDKSFFMIETTVNFMDAADVRKLARTVRAAGPSFDLVVVDTVSRAMPGADENLQKDMTLFVAACDAVRDVCGGAVIGVHHAGKSGDMRGSTVLLGAGDFVFRLERKKGATVGALACEKQKDGPDGWEEPYSFDVVRLDGAGDTDGIEGAGETSLVVSRCEMGIGPSVELTPELSERVLVAIRAAQDAGEPWARAPQAGERHGVRRMVSDFGFTADRAEETLRLWEQMGVLSYGVADSHSKRKGYLVTGEIGQSVTNDGIFG